MKAGDFFNVSPPKKHRVIAITDIILQEVSTPEVDDVIRINAGEKALVLDAIADILVSKID